MRRDYLAREYLHESLSAAWRRVRMESLLQSEPTAFSVAIVRAALGVVRRDGVELGSFAMASYARPRGIPTPRRQLTQSSHEAPHAQPKNANTRIEGISRWYAHTSAIRRRRSRTLEQACAIYAPSPVIFSASFSAIQSSE